jgi:hypothetical protein
MCLRCVVPQAPLASEGFFSELLQDDDASVMSRHE